jgi:uncharacterized protein YjbI with pentapeptide repeats
LGRKCAAKSKRINWTCDREAVVTMDSGTHLCILHLTRDHQLKTDEEFKRALLADHMEHRTRQDDEAWDLRGVVFPKHFDVTAALLPEGLRGADLSEANLSLCDVTDTDLAGSKLEHANLRDADIGGANLSCANLSRANLTNVDFNNALLTNVVISGAVFETEDIGRAAELSLSKDSYLSTTSLLTVSLREYAEDLLRLRNNLRHHGRQGMADLKYVKEQRARRAMLWAYRDFHVHDPGSRSAPRKVWDWLRFRARYFGSLLFDGVALYGNSPWRVFLISALVMFVFGCVYWWHSATGNPPFNQIRTWFDNFYYSVSTFTTLGIGTPFPEETWAKIMTSIEAWIGAAMMSLFVFSLGRKALR